MRLRNAPSTCRGEASRQLLRSTGNLVPDPQRNLSGTNAFRLVSVNEDIRTADARRFLDEFGLQLPVLLGQGRSKRTLHYPGLPYTLLIDGDGRVVRKWIGFTGPSQIDDIRAAIHTQLVELSAANSHAHHRATSGDASR